LNSLGRVGVPPNPSRPIGPGLPQKAGVSLFVAATARKLSEGREGMSFLTRFVARPDRLMEPYGAWRWRLPTAMKILSRAN